MSTQRKSCKNTGPMLPGFETLETAEKKTLSGLTLSAGGFHVKTFPLPESAQGLKESAQLFGQNSIESFAKLDQDGCWLKMYQGYCQVMMDGSLEKFSGTWPKAGMMRNGTLYQRQHWGDFTEETDFFYLPTPVAYDSTPGGPNNYYKGMGNLAKHQPRKLQQMIESCGINLDVKIETMIVRFVEWMMTFPQNWTKTTDSDV